MQVITSISFFGGPPHSWNRARIFLKNACFYLLFSYATDFFGQCNGVPRNASIISDIGSGPGVVAWTNPPNGQYSDNVRTTAGVKMSANTTAITHYLHARDFGFSLPGNAIICGIEVRIEHRKQGGNSACFVKDYSVELISGSIVSANYAKTTTWSDTDEVYIYGNNADAWGPGWTATDINNSGFGVQLTANLCTGASGANMSAEIDQVSVTVFADQPLPVELLSFNAQKGREEKVDLEWITATETNNDHFVVERSRNAIDFTEVLKMNGAGNSILAHTYWAIDEHPYYGLSYYRVKQVDYNGNYSYSPLRQVNLIASKGIHVRSVPGMIYMDFDTGERKLVSLQLIDMRGAIVLSSRSEIQDDRQLRINTEHLAGGIYFIRARVDLDEYCQKTFVMKE